MVVAKDQALAAELSELQRDGKLFVTTRVVERATPDGFVYLLFKVIEHKGIMYVVDEKRSTL